MIISVILPSIFWLYNFIVKSDREINARQSVIQQWYEFFERLNVFMQDYTIDYEEYYNRQMVWCVEWWGRGPEFTWNIWIEWYCTQPTGYWNENSTGRKLTNEKDHDIYYCSSIATSNGKFAVVKGKDACWLYWSKQSYGQYKSLFTDVQNDTNDDDGGDVVWDWNDLDLWRPLNDDIEAIQDANHIQELYFISHDWKRRLFFRRQNVASEGEKPQYKIYMLRLRWFDAGRKHKFSNVSSENVGLYDWKIDTWACDTSMWFVWHWESVDDGWVYKDYYLPLNWDDCRIPLTYWSTTISARNIWISPTVDSDLYWNGDGQNEALHQVNAYMKILTVNWVYLPYYTNRSISDSIADFEVPLQTTINMKDFYRS